MLDTQLIARFDAGDRRSLARLITRIDNDPSIGPQLLAELGPAKARAAIIGITGAPGVGKSTLLGRLIGGYASRGRRIAALAVDPQSPISGGALLGDRIRMAEPAARDGDVFIRSLSNRGATGGLSASVRWICRLLERFGYDLILLETVGVGQSELAVLRVADIVVLMVMPGTGDTVQWEKAGLVEVCHMVVINKADHPGVERVEQELREALRDGVANGGEGCRPILRTVANEDIGVASVLDQLDGLLAARPPLEWHQAQTEILQEAEMLLTQRLDRLGRGDPQLGELARAVAAGKLDISAAAQSVLLTLLPRLSE